MIRFFKLFIPHFLFSLVCGVLLFARIFLSLISGFDHKAGFVTSLLVWLLLLGLIIFLGIRYLRYYFHRVVVPLSPDTTKRFNVALQGGIPFYGMFLFCLVVWQGGNMVDVSGEHWIHGWIVFGFLGTVIFGLLSLIYTIVMRSYCKKLNDHAAM